MLEVNLFDSEFIHTEKLLGYITCSDILEPKKIKWINGKYDFNGITVFTDRYIDFNFDLEYISDSHLKELLEQVTRCKKLINGFINYFQKQTTNQQPTTINEILQAYGNNDSN